MRRTKLNYFVAVVHIVGNFRKCINIIWSVRSNETCTSDLLITLTLQQSDFIFFWAREDALRWVEATPRSQFLDVVDDCSSARHRYESWFSHRDGEWKSSRDGITLFVEIIWNIHWHQVTSPHSGGYFDNLTITSSHEIWIVPDWGPTTDCWNILSPNKRSTLS